MMPYCLVFAECIGSPICSFCIHIREGARVNLSLLSAGADVFLLLVSIHNRDSGEMVER